MNYECESLGDEFGEWKENSKFDEWIDWWTSGSEAWWNDEFGEW